MPAAVAVAACSYNIINKRLPGEQQRRTAAVPAIRQAAPASAYLKTSCAAVLYRPAMLCSTQQCRKPCSSVVAASVHVHAAVDFSWNPAHCCMSSLLAHPCIHHVLKVLPAAPAHAHFCCCCCLQAGRTPRTGTPSRWVAAPARRLQPPVCRACSAAAHVFCMTFPLLAASMLQGALACLHICSSVLHTPCQHHVPAQ